MPDPAALDAVRFHLNRALDELLDVEAAEVDPAKYRASVGRAFQSAGEALAVALTSPAFPEAPEPAEICPECADRGWLVMNEGPAPEHLGDVQRCDCDIFADDEAAIHSARRAGYVVEDSGEIVAVPK